jgi:hypothetical protein
MKFVLLIVSLVALCACILASCNSNGSSVSPSAQLTPEEEREYTTVLDLQQRGVALFAQLVASTDTATAIDSIARFVRTDTAVQSAVAGSQGVAIQYKSGINGGIFLLPGDLEQSLPESLRTLSDPVGMPAKLPGIRTIVPSSRRAALLDPHYFERRALTDTIIARYNRWIPQIGYDPLETYLNSDAGLDKFEHLSDHGYGFIQIYSHGWAWPEETAIEKVYLMTGEVINTTMLLRYRDQIWREKAIAIMTGSDNIHRFWISYDFVRTRWDFERDSSIIYGAYCYSGLGGWDSLRYKNGAAGHLFVDWAVASDWCTYWGRSFIMEMTDTTRPVAMTAAEWIVYQSQPRGYTDKQGHSVRLWLTQRDEVALWHRDNPLADVRSMSITLGGFNVTYTGSGCALPAPEGWGRTWNHVPCTFTGHTFETEWSDTAIWTLLGPANRNVRIAITLSSNLDAVVWFEAREITFFPNYNCSDTTTFVGSGIGLRTPGEGPGILNYLEQGTSVCAKVTPRYSRTCGWGTDTCAYTFSSVQCADDAAVVISFDDK